jgi:hypothetical protein
MMKKLLRAAAGGGLTCVIGCGATDGGESSRASRSADEADPVVVIDWSMPDKFGLDLDHDGLVDVNPVAAVNPDESPVVGDPFRPRAWKVGLDGCASTPAQSYAWDIYLDGRSAAPTHIESGSNCAIQTTFPAQGTYFVVLTLNFADGTTWNDGRWITIKNYLVVSMGDSIASGEGAPEVPSASSPVWSDRRCHRSINSGHAQAALLLERSDPHSSVTFVSVACSGAKISEGLLTPYAGLEPPDGAPALATQIDQVKAEICPIFGSPPGSTVPPPPCPAIDAVLLTVGANDVGFKDVAEKCGRPGPPLSIYECWADDDLVNTTAANLAALPGHYTDLDTAIRDTLPVKHIYFAEYDDPTHGGQGDYCDMVLPGAVTDNGDGVAFGDGDIDPSESQWAHDHVLAPINANALQAAHDHGWTYIGGIADEFLTHGYCANDHWITRYDESKAVEGGEIYGSLHPNVPGYQAIGATVATQLENDLGAHGFMITSDRDRNLAVHIAGGVGEGNALEISDRCTISDPTCTWSYQRGMLVSDADPRYAVNAYGGADEGVVLAVTQYCTQDNPDCTFTYESGEFLSDRDWSLGMNAWYGARPGATVLLTRLCAADNPDCTWTIPHLMVSSARDATLGINAYGGAFDHTALKTFPCRPDNPDCTWTFHRGMMISDRDPFLAVNAYGGAGDDVGLEINDLCAASNPDCTWMWTQGEIVSDNWAAGWLPVNAWGGAVPQASLRLESSCWSDNPDCLFSGLFAGPQ